MEAGNHNKAGEYGLADVNQETCLSVSPGNQLTCSSSSVSRICWTTQTSPIPLRLTRIRCSSEFSLHSSPEGRFLNADGKKRQEWVREEDQTAGAGTTPKIGGNASRCSSPLYDITTLFLRPNCHIHIILGLDPPR